MKQKLILLAAIGLLASCDKQRVIYSKSVSLEHPSFSYYSYSGGGFTNCSFVDSSNKYNIGDTIK